MRYWLKVSRRAAGIPSTDIERINEMQSAWDASAKYKYSTNSTIHNPQEIGADGNIHTWTLELNGESFRVTREVWEAYHKDNAALRKAGEKMAKQLRENRQVVKLGIVADQWAFTPDDAAALAEWEAANK
jgi:hypothetical protein